MRSLVVILVLLATFAGGSASALTLPDNGQYYFVGSTQQLLKIRAAIREMVCQDRGPTIPYCTHNNGSVSCVDIPNPYCGTNTYPWGESAQVLQPPWGMGAVDCMTAYVHETQQYLGRSVTVNGELITVPVQSELVNQDDWPGECYGFQFALQCATPDPWWNEMVCPDPAP